MLFKKTKYLEKQINDLSKRVEDLSERTAKLERIVEYAKDEPSFNLSRSYSLIFGYKYDLFLYIDKKEYVIEGIATSSIGYFRNEDCKLKVKDDIAIFTVKSSKDFKLKFLIDYKKGTYVVTDTDFKESEE